jgi:hypothetical protein
MLRTRRSRRVVGAGFSRRAITEALETRRLLAFAAQAAATPLPGWDDAGSFGTRFAADVAVYGTGDFAVVNNEGGFIERFTSTGSSARQIFGSGFSLGTRASIAATPTGQLYVASVYLEPDFGGIEPYAGTEFLDVAHVPDLNATFASPFVREGGGTYSLVGAMYGSRTSIAAGTGGSYAATRFRPVAGGFEVVDGVLVAGTGPSAFDSTQTTIFASDSSVAINGNSTLHIARNRFNFPSELSMLRGPIPYGGTPTVLTSPTSTQIYTPAIDTASDGRSVVVWIDSFSQVLAQRYSASGSIVGSAITVGSFAAGSFNFTNPRVDVAMDDSGKFAVVWETGGQVFTRGYNADGTADGAALRVDASANVADWPSIESTGDGKYVITWNQGSNQGAQVYFRRFSFQTDVTPPSATAGVFEFETGHAVSITFDEDVSLSLSPSDLTISPIGGGNVLSASSVSWNAATLTATFSLLLLPDGRYFATLSASGVSDPAGNTLASDFVLNDFHVLAGDVNRDRGVNFADLLILAQNYGQTGRTYSQGNIDYSLDGLVGFNDLLILAQNYNASLIRTEPKPSVFGSRSIGRRGLFEAEEAVIV